MKVLWITVILALSQAYAQEQKQQSQCCEEYCYGTDKDRPQTLRFTSKTAYELAKGKDVEQNIPNCSPTKIWSLSRHGTRLPSAKTIEKIKHLEEIQSKIEQNYKVLKTKPTTGALCMEDFLIIKTWRFNSSITPDKENMLTSKGWEDLKLLAKTYQRQYPHILLKEYRPQNFLFRHTGIQRTEESFKAYAEGLFGPNVWQTIHISKPDNGNDTLLRPYDYCPKWEENNSQKEGTEFEKFKSSAIMNKTVSDISLRLGFLYSLEFQDIELMWDMCRYELAWNVDRVSAWCSAFTPGQIKVLEYYDDLRYYKKSGYGSEINTKLPCEIIKDMLFQLNSKTMPNAITNFGHSTIIQSMITALGWFKDAEALTADNYESMENRQWRMSKIDPFGSNLVAIKYDCPADGADSEKVLFLLNQKTVQLSWCRVGLCDWSNVMKHYSDFYNGNCSETFCQSGAASISSMLTLLSFLVAAIVYLIY